MSFGLAAGSRLSGIILLLLAACGRGEPAPARPDEPLNLLLISIDSLRADHVGAYGYQARFVPERAVTPELDALARDGLRFHSCWSSSSWTLPAHVALLTGLDDLSHGVHDEHFRIDPQHQTLAEHLGAAGYQCRGIWSGPFLDSRYGFDRGFSSWRSARISETELIAEIEEWKQRRRALGLPAPSTAEIDAMRAQSANWDVTGHRVNRLALESLDELAAGARPWFLFLHYYDPHYDYLPGEADPTLADAFDPEYRGDFDGVRWYFDERVREFSPASTRRIPERDLQHVEALYDGEIHFVDRQIGSVLRRLDRLGLRERTVVAVVSDHGDEFFDRGGIGHRHHLYQELTRAVWLMRAPGRIAPGAAVGQAVSFVDVAPTLLDAMQAPPWTQPFGHSRLPGRVGADSGAFSHLIARVPPYGARNFESWRDSRFTVIRRLVEAPVGAEPPTGPRSFVQPRFPDGSPAYLVFDRQEDPYEQRPIPPDQPAYQRAVGAMRADFLHRAQLRAGLPQSPFDQRLSSPLEAAEARQLLELGYREGLERPAARPITPFPAPDELGTDG